MRMQLTRCRPIRNTLATLTAALVSSGAVGATSHGQTEASLLLYSESNRISATEVLGSFSRSVGSGFTLSFKGTYDGLTGATPTGAAPSRLDQTITGASGRATVIPAGSIPLNRHFSDTRFAFDGSVGHPLDHFTTVTFGVHASDEKDYSSLGVNASLTRDFNQKNTTVGLSGSYSHDAVFPKGGVPLPFSSADSGSAQGDFLKSSQPKNVYDCIVSLTQIVDQRTILRLNYSWDRSTGYLNDPYKILSWVQGPSSPDAGEPYAGIHENRPNSHAKNAIFGEIRRYMFGTSVDISYRYFWDSWGIKAHTIDLAPLYRWQNGSSLQPHLRWYQQSRADFYLPFLVDNGTGKVTQQYASSDSRLAKFNGYTVGLKFMFPVADDVRLAVTGEYYAQRGDHSPPEAFGTQLNWNLFPNLDAVELRLSVVHDL
jgi:hypothetical protein